ncbi:hypothetical protein ACFU7Y_38120 [Kitasatospora sp. NPDC057542]|uniref:hypothetical protein n=1 Tax=Streptomycetaceae TaxID=2062 RepID=UPI001CCB3487|nr:hypothetical protein [Streptomyces sp. LS1784]
MFTELTRAVGAVFTARPRAAVPKRAGEGRMVSGILTSHLNSYSLLGMSDRHPIECAAIELALIGVAAHCVSDNLCR